MAKAAAQPATQVDAQVDTQSEPARPQVRLRGRSYVAFVFAPTVPIVDWLSEIDQTLTRSPGFFIDKPVVLDLSAVDISRPAIAHLLLSLEKRNIRVLGIEGVAPTSLAANMPPLLSGGRSCAIAQQPAQEKSEAKAEASAEPASPTSLLLDSPARSGKAVIFPEGDVTIVGSVSPGAEIVGGGSHHIYGTVRGS